MTNLTPEQAADIILSEVSKEVITWEIIDYIQKPNHVPLFERILSIIQAQRDAANQWLPIETAPKDGIAYLAAEAGTPDISCMVDYGDGDEADQFCIEQFKPTHWMPLPQPPEVTA